MAGPIEAVALAVSRGETKSQFAIPNGAWLGDLFFITDAEHKILMAFVWNGVRWVHEHEVMPISKESTEDSVAAAYYTDSSKFVIGVAGENILCGDVVSINPSTGIVTVVPIRL